MKYELQYRNKPVGNVVVKKTGLYYEIECCFLENRRKRFNLIAVSSNREVNLGECRLDDAQFRMTRYLPIKSVGGELVRFYIIAFENTGDGCSVFVDRAFPYIDKLEGAILIIADKEKKIVIKNCYSAQI